MRCPSNRIYGDALPGHGVFVPVEQGAAALGFAVGIAEVDVPGFGELGGTFGKTGHSL